MADAEDLKSSGVLPHGGSNPPPGTILKSIETETHRSGGRLSPPAPEVRPGDGFSPGVFDFLQPTLTLCIPRFLSQYTNAQ